MQLFPLVFDDILYLYELLHTDTDVSWEQSASAFNIKCLICYHHFHSCKLNSKL